MPDISMCANLMCPSHLKCYRFTATPNDRAQSWLDFTVPKGKSRCASFMPNTTRKSIYGKNPTQFKENVCYKLLVDKPYGINIGKAGDVCRCVSTKFMPHVILDILGPTDIDRSQYYKQQIPASELRNFVVTVHPRTKPTPPDLVIRAKKLKLKVGGLYKILKTDKEQLIIGLPNDIIECLALYEKTVSFNIVGPSLTKRTEFYNRNISIARLCLDKYICPAPKGAKITLPERR